MHFPTITKQLTALIDMKESLLTLSKPYNKNVIRKTHLNLQVHTGMGMHTVLINRILSILTASQWDMRGTQRAEHSVVMDVFIPS